jgi:hypothetical protein
MTRPLIASVAFTLLLPLTAAAQTEAQPPVNQGPMIVERIHGGWLAAPDAKITDVAHSTSTLVGGYGGWLTDSRFFIGGGGYWLANGRNNLDMAYGGVIVGWFGGVDQRVGFGAKALIGGGETTQNVSAISPLSPYNNFPDIRNPGGRPLPAPQPPVAATVRFQEDFFVAEPEFNVIVHVAQHVRLTGGVGYRFVDSYRYHNYYYPYYDYDNHLSGVTGSIAVQIGGAF